MVAGLTKGAQEVLTLLQSGWELGVRSQLLGRRVFIQNGGIGKGGESRKVREAVYQALATGNHLVRSKDSNSTTTVYVAAKGVSAKPLS